MKKHNKTNNPTKEGTLRKALLWGVVIGLLLFVVNLVFGFLFGRGLPSFQLGAKNAFVYVLYAASLSFINTYLNQYLNSKFSWETQAKARLIFGFFGSILVTWGTFFVVRVLHRVGVDGLSFELFLQTESFHFYWVVLLVALIISLFFHAFYFYKALQETKVKEQKIIAGTASAQFESLKNQIDPHFLFNSLNVLTALIEENPENAQQFTTSLSKIYRYVLDQRDKELVSVTEELAFAETYMELLKMRFENSISYQIPEQLKNPEAKVVPLSLQLLLENAIKHNVVSESKPLHINIYEQDNQLIIENNYQKKDVLQSRKGVGLQNIANRYAILTDRKMLIEQTDGAFRVKLPELTKQITRMETMENNQENAYYKARKRVKDMKDFYGHLTSYCVVIPFLIFINYYTFWEVKWFLFPMLGWGLGLTIHGFTVFGFGARWEERKIHELMERDHSDSHRWR